jgi:hypothetical protein
MGTKLDGLQLPGGRLVMGSLIEKVIKDQKGQPIPLEKQQYFFGIAVPKNAPGVTEIINSLWTLAATDYGNVPLVMAQVNQGLGAQSFAWKISDGDVPNYDDKGQLRPVLDHHKGCFIFKFKTSYVISACDDQGIDIGLDKIKVGDYVDLLFNAQINGNLDHTAGIYLNPTHIRRLGYGEAIVTGVSASRAFAGRAAVIPPGATAMPTGAPMGNAAPVQQPMASAAGMPGTTAMPGAAGMPSPASHSSGVTPHPTILQGPGAGGGMPGMR